MPAFQRPIAAALMLILIAPGLAALAAPPNAPEEKAKIVGQPTAIVVQPPSITLVAARGMQQLLVPGHYPDRTVLGLEGGFLAQNAMYGRGGEPCPACGAYTLCCPEPVDAAPRRPRRGKRSDTRKAEGF